jgi:hypothetical protein
LLGECDLAVACALGIFKLCEHLVQDDFLDLDAIRLLVGGDTGGESEANGKWGNFSLARHDMGEVLGWDEDVASAIGWPDSLVDGCSGRRKVHWITDLVGIPRLRVGTAMGGAAIEVAGLGTGCTGAKRSRVRVSPDGGGALGFFLVIIVIELKVGFGIAGVKLIKILLVHIEIVIEIVVNRHCAQSERECVRRLVRVVQRSHGTCFWWAR